MGIFQVLGRGGAQQAVLDLTHRLSGRQANAVGEPEDMRVDRERGFAERGVEYHVGGFAAHTR